MVYDVTPYPLVLLAVPVGLRATCYYFRGFYEKHLFRHPGRCGREEGMQWRMPLLGSPTYGKAFYLHRYFLVLSVLLLVPHLLDALATLWEAGHLRLGGLLQWLDLLFLALYVGTCHSFRYALGSGEGCYSCMSPSRRRTYAEQSRLNRYHGHFFWLSLVSLLAFAAFARLHASGALTDPVIL